MGIDPERTCSGSFSFAIPHAHSFRLRPYHIPTGAGVSAHAGNGSCPRPSRDATRARCNVCGRGAIAKILDNGNSQGAVLESFLPQAVEKAVLPLSVPEDIVKEFRESELDAAHGAYRSGSALLRSVLEKTLKKNGYDEVEYNDKGVKKKSRSLLHRIDAASEDGVITETRKKRAHENIRVLGNDILHDDWREVKQEEFDEAQKYSQRVLEDFYDDRPTVEARLRSSGRIP
jgi:Domain of unknown function (DUF4145)